MKKSILLRISLCLFAVLVCIGCKKIYQQKNPSNIGRMLEVELRMPEPWKHIIIGPSQQKEYPKVPSRFNMFMTGESIGTLKPYLNVSSEISQLSQQRPIE